MVLVPEQDWKMAEPGFLKLDREPRARERGAEQGCCSTAHGEALHSSLLTLCWLYLEAKGAGCFSSWEGLPGRTNSPAAAWGMIHIQEQATTRGL